jgi:Putative MetA-pathway of phenol degradation
MPHPLCFRPRLRGLLVLLTSLSSASVSAQESDAEREETYHLFNPVPRAQMRDFTPDRPGASENPFTVDAGHYHLEIGIASLAFDDSDDAESTELAFAETKVRAGLVPWLELQLVVVPYYRSEVEGSSEVADSETVVDEGYIATTLRLKLNLWGNDGETTALGVLPFVSFADDAVDFGLALPFAMALPFELGFGATLVGDFVPLDDGDRGVELIATAVLGRDLVGPLSGYVELVGVYTAHDANESALAFETGLALAILADLQIDLSARFGLVGPVADIQLFAGVAGRL